MLRKMIAAIALGMGIFLVAQSIPSGQAAAAQHDRGRKLFLQYCASCHGVDGKGSGPVAPSLKSSVPDLTTIEKRDGKFDQVKIQNIIAGDINFPAHGQKEMPVWGFVFRQKAGGQAVSTANIYALGNYLKAIQQ